ncbi:MAG TPA: hypothetical protein VJ960_06540 [Oceanipulchritudo sp.]|nr:hypothetical protein [Oceanipulchritudo sp.]
MQKIIIDLPDLGERVNLPSSQWKHIRQWLEERKITYEEKEPEMARTGTDNDTVMVFEIQDHNEEVEKYLRKRR